MNTVEPTKPTKEKEEKTVDKVNNWIGNSASIKLIIITVLMLLLLIPSSMIQSIIYEREQLNEEAQREVSEKWAGSQEIKGPILSIPVTYKKQINGVWTDYRVHWHILPKDLKINGEVDPEILKRGIYEVIVYRSELNIGGTFEIPEKLDTNNLVKVNYNEAFLTMGVSDLRGIKNRIQVKWNAKQLEAEPGSRLSQLIYSGLTVNLPTIDNQANRSFDFQLKLDIKGSKDLSFVPLGGHTSVNIQSPWTAPSFNGGFLPDEREINANGFKANWEILQLNRNFSDSWTSKINPEYASLFNSQMRDAAFGFSLLMPLDNYQKSMRSAKYAVMTIALTFLIFFLVEIISRRKIHPFQYALVGLALCLFYVLLVSITEHTNFNIAFGLSTLGIVSLISLYSLSVFKAKKFSFLLVSTLIGIYGFLFVTLQMTDYALLMGSVGLLLILAATMYFTRNINWYQLNFENK